MSDRSTTTTTTAAVAAAAAAAGSLRARHELALDALYERKRDNKSMRVLTVLIYVLCVSLAAIILSLYYVFFWEPKDAQYSQRKVAHTVVKQTSTTPLPTCLLPYTGGSNTTMNVTSEEPTVNSTNTFAANSSTQSPQHVYRPSGHHLNSTNDVDLRATTHEDRNNTTPQLHINSSII